MTTTTEALRVELQRLFTSYGNAMYRHDPDGAEALAGKFSAAISAIDAAPSVEPVAPRTWKPLDTYPAWPDGVPEASGATPQAQPAQAPSVEPVAWVNGATLKSAAVSRDRGGPYDLHTWSDTRTAYHDTPLKAATPQAQPAEPAVQAPLTDAEIERGRRETFSVDNPFCPCTDKTMRKAVRWAERTLAKAWGVKLAGITPQEGA